MLRVKQGASKTYSEFIAQNFSCLYLISITCDAFRDCDTIWDCDTIQKNMVICCFCL